MTTIRRDFSTLPDLPLLEVFSSLPLTDLFINASLVCRNWYRIRTVALSQRKHLYIGAPEMIRIRQLDEHILPTGPPVAINQYSSVDRIPVDWCCTNSSTITTTTEVQLNTLPLPSEHTDDTESSSNRHLRALSSGLVVDCIARGLPHLTELTVVVNEAQVVDSASNARVVSNVARLLGHYTSSLSLLRLHLYNRRTTAEIGAFDLLARAVNTLTQLRSLQLHLYSYPNSQVRKSTLSSPSEELSPALLARLRSLVVIHCPDHWLQALLINGTTDGLTTAAGARDIYDIYDLNPSQQQLAILFLLKPPWFVPHSSAALLRPRVCLLNSIYTTDLSRLLRDFPGLTALSLKYSKGDGRHYRRVLSQLRRAALSSLSVSRFQVSDLQPQHLPVLTSVRHLTLLKVRFPNILTVDRHHAGIVSRLYLGHCFPRLERLRLQVYFEGTSAYSDTVGCCCQTLAQVTECCEEVLGSLLHCPSPPNHLTTVLLDLNPNFPPALFVRSTAAAAAAGDVQFTHQSYVPTAQ